MARDFILILVNVFWRSALPTSKIWVRQSFLAGNLSSVAVDMVITGLNILTCCIKTCCNLALQQVCVSRQVVISSWLCFIFEMSRHQLDCFSVAVNSFTSNCKACVFYIRKYCLKVFSGRDVSRCTSIMEFAPLVLRPEQGNWGVRIGSRIDINAIIMPRASWIASFVTLWFDW